MGRSSRGPENFGSTDLFDPNRNDVIPPIDNLGDARLPQRQCAQDRCDNRSDRFSNNSELAAFRAGYRAAYGDGYEDGQRAMSVRVGSGQGSYCPDYDDYVIRRQVNSQLEAWRDQGDDFGRQRYPIPNFRRQYQRQVDYVYDDLDPRYGNVRAVSAGDYDYALQDVPRGRNFFDGLFVGIGQVARGIGDAAYQILPAIQAWGQIQAIRDGGYGGFGSSYFGRYGRNDGYGYYNDRPYNPWNSARNRDLIRLNNNAGYYDNYNDRYARNGYQPTWLFG